MERVNALFHKFDQNLQDGKFRATLYAAAVAMALAAFYTSRRIRAYVRMFLLLCTIAFNSTWGILISFFAGIETNYYATRAFADVCEWTVGLKIVVEGKGHLENGASVIVCNHQSMLDMIFVGRCIPKRLVVLAKKQLKWLPFLGQYLVFSKTIFIDRSNNKDAIATMRAAGQQLLVQDASLFIFPEGTRSLSKESSLRPFKKGAFHVAIEAGIPIIPVVFENQWKFYRPGVFESAVCKIKILPSIPTKGMKAEEATVLAESTRELMLKTLKEMSTS